MNKTLTLARKGFLAIFMLLGTLLQAQTLDLVQPPNLSVCTGDSLKITMTIGSNNFNAGNQFIVLFDDGLLTSFDVTVADTLAIERWQSITPSPVGTSADTLTAGVKYFWIIVPADITSNNFYSLAVRSTNPSGIWSDTIQMTVNVSPESSIDSIHGGYNNLYTPTNDWGFCEDDTITLYAVAGMQTYQWFAGGAPIAGEVNDSLKVFASGDYAVEVGSGNCSSISSDTTINAFSPVTDLTHSTVATLTVLDNDPQIDSLQFCDTDSITLTGPPAFTPGTGVNYQWLMDSVDLFGQTIVVAIAGEKSMNYSTNVAGRYSLETTWLPGGCADTSYTVELFIDTVPDATIENVPWPGFAIASLSICPSDSTLLQSATTSVMNDWEYQWQVLYPVSSGVWKDLPGEDAYQLTADTTTAPGTAQYRLYITNAACEHYTAAMQVELVPLPTVQVAPSDSLAVCAGDSLLIGATGNGLIYSWTWPGGSYAGTSFYAKDAGIYVVEAIGLNDCVSYDTLELSHVTVTPDAGPDQTVLPGEVVQLAGSGGDTFYWYADRPVYFSDPYNPNAQTKPTQDTTMYILEVMTDFGCFGTDTMMVIVFDPSIYDVNISHVMNLISPNGDGMNDVFDLSEVVQADSCDLIVFDRWGSIVFEQAQYITGWDGINQGGADLPNGTYYYVLMCNDVARFRGAITVVRNIQ